MSMQAEIEKSKKADKPREKRRGGVLRGVSRPMRVMVFVVLVLACAALTFTQLGFAAIGVPGEPTSAYIVVLLLPIALGALLLGALDGTLIGLAAGGILYGHATAMPLDYYEMDFVTPLTSVIMLGVCGFLLGLLFAFVLRHDPGQVKRVIYITIVCIIVSFLYSVGFISNVFLTVMANVATELSADMAATGVSTIDSAQLSELAEADIGLMVFRMGDLGLQMMVDAVLMAVACIVVDALARKAMRSIGQMGLRGMFAARLAAVVLVAFMVTAGVSFVAITQGKLTEASQDMNNEADYLCKQLAVANGRSEALIDLLKKQNVDLSSLSDEAWDNLVKLVSIDTLLDGYTKEGDGTILVLINDFDITNDMQAVENGDYQILLSDDDDFAVGKSLGELVDEDFMNGVRVSLAENAMCRVIYDDINGKSIAEIANEGDSIHSEIAYVYAEEADEGYTVFVMYKAGKVFADRSAIMLWTTLSAFVLLAVVFAMVFQLLSRVVVRRIDETNGVLGRITGGDLEARVDVRDSREFKSLSSGINTTVDALKGWIAEAESRIDAELATAKAIQESALPSIFPPFPDIRRFDVYASMKAAREVGGDFYDFFLIGEDCDADAGKLGFVIADVSGKGVPASLFMMKSMTLLRDYLKSEMEIGEAFENANRQLCEGNDEGMFVTVWAGVLDYGTDHVEFVNAGHNPPLLWQKDGGWRWLEEKSGLPLGLFEGLPYESFSLECGIGDQFLLYTDGVTEAMSVEGELYGEDRLMALVNEDFTMHPRMLVGAVRQDVAAWAKGAEQSDDITVMSLEVGVPPEITATLKLPAIVTNLPIVNEFIHSELDRRLCPKRVQNQLDIAVEELFVNVCHYAYPDATPEKPGTVRVLRTFSAEPPSIVVDIVDEGVPYDPLAKPDAVTPDNIEDVPIGGLGILMAKKCTDEMRYERLDGSNIVTIVKKW